MPEEQEIKIDPEKFAENFLSGKSDGGSGDDASSIPDIPPSAEEQKPEQEPELDEYWKPVYETYKDNEGFTLPEEIKTGKDKDGNELSPQRKAELYRDTIANLNKPGSIEDIDDPFIKSYVEASKQEGFNRDTFLQSEMRMQTIMSAPANEFLIEAYKQESKNRNLNWTDDDITKHVESLGSIGQQREADVIKQSMRQQQVQQFSDIAEKERVTLEKDVVPNVNKEQATLNDLFIKDIQSTMTIGGFRFEEDEKSKFISEIPAFTEKKLVKLEDGSHEVMSDADSVLYELMANPKSSMQLLPYLWLIKQGNIQGYSSKLIEKEKKKAIEKLDREPERQSGASATKTFSKEQFIKGK